MNDNRLAIRSVPVDPVSAKEAARTCRAFLSGNAQRRIVTVNPEFAVAAARNPRFREVLWTSDLALADGMGMVLAARWLLGKRIERVTGVDLMADLARIAAERGNAVFFLGGQGGCAKKAAGVMRSRYPGLSVAGWSEEDDPSRIDIKDASIIFVAFGAPKQELWIADNLSKFPGIRIAMGVGGAFDMIAGKTPRAPHRLRSAGFEWLWRLFIEPGRWRRIATATMRFPILVLFGR